MAGNTAGSIPAPLTNRATPVDAAAHAALPDGAGRAEATARRQRLPKGFAMNIDKTAAINAARKTVAFGKAAGIIIALYGLFISREHITHVGYAMGLDALAAETLFVFVDFIAIYGKVLTSPRLAAKTRRIGYRLLIVGITLSVVCNVTSGILHHSIGAAVYGAFVVAIVAMVEYAVANTRAKSTATTRTRKAAKVEAAPALTPAQRGAVTRKRNREIRELEAQMAADAASVNA